MLCRCLGVKNETLDFYKQASEFDELLLMIFWSYRHLWVELRGVRLRGRIILVVVVVIMIMMIIFHICYRYFVANFSANHT